MLTGKQINALASITSNNAPHLRFIVLDNNGVQEAAMPDYEARSYGSPFNCARLWATDGHCLMTYTLEGVLGPHEPTAYCVETTLAKLPARHKLVIDDERRLADDRGYYLNLFDVHIPSIDVVVPSYEFTSEAPRQGFNPALIQRVMKALVGVTPKVALNGSIAAEFQFGGTSLSPTKIEYGPTMAIVMPCRL